MKKIVLSLAVVFGLGINQVNAQDLAVSFGAKANANMSNFLLNDMKNSESKMKVGASVAGFAKLEFTEHFALQPELLFYYQGSKMKDKTTGIEFDRDFWGMQIPIYAVGQMNLGNGKGYVGVGPYIGFGFSGNSDPGDIDLYKKDKITDKAAMNRWDFGGSLMLGYEFSNRVSVNATYQIGIIDLLDAGKKNADMRNHAVSLGVGYRF